MVTLLKVGLRLGCLSRAFYFSVLLFAAGNIIAAAQCSQAPRPAQAPEKSAPTEQGAPPGSGSEESSSAPEAAKSVRFVTGRAVTVLEETTLQVINDMPISSRTTKAGAKISFTVTRDVVVDDVLVIPCGATVYGTVVAAKQAGRLAGASNLTLELNGLNLDGKSYPLYTAPFKAVSESKTRPTTKKIAAGAAVGAVAMDVRAATMSFPVRPGERAISDGLAAGVGAGVGTAIAASSPPSIALIPAESQIEFTLTSPIAVYPVDQRTAAKLAEGMHRGGPVLYVRGEN